MSDDAYPRDLKGYGANPPDPRWPGGARLALSVVLNFEEGGERSVLHGDATSEVYLTEVAGLAPRAGQRDETVESLYDYGMRAGVWRIAREFERRQLPLTVYAVGMAAMRSPQALRALADAGHEIASHGWRWFDYAGIDRATERQHMRLAIEAIEKACGQRPLGWYTGRLSGHTRELVVEEGGFLYDSDAYDDDLPYWTRVAGKPHLVIPYTLDNNDMRYGLANGFATGEDFHAYLRDAFDVLWREGEGGRPKLMSVGLHLRMAGRPGRFAALQRFLDHVQKHDGVWVCRRVDIARHWRREHPFTGG